MLGLFVSFLMGLCVPYIIILLILNYIGTTLPSLINLVLIYLGLAAIAALPVSMIYRKKKAEEYARKHSKTMKQF